MFKLNDNNTKTRDFYETRILKIINISNFKTKNKVEHDASGADENDDF